VPVAIVLAAVVILGGIIVVAMGKGGELSKERPEFPARTDFLSWSDVAEYRPPGALLGYHAGATERAFALISRTIAERDAEIDWLRKRLAELQPERPGGISPGSASAFGAYASPQDGDEDVDGFSDTGAGSSAPPAASSAAALPAFGDDE
jgi:hypothetical protein